MRETALREKRSHILLYVVGIISGISSQLNGLAGSSAGAVDAQTLLLQTIAAVFVFPLSLFGMRKIVRRIVSRFSLTASVYNRYLKYDSLTYAVFLATVFGAAGMQFPFPVAVLIVLFFLSLQFFLIYLLMSAENRKEMLLSTDWLSFLFLLSGFAALIYQIVWQKALFTAFGVNIESVTIIVSIFMFGLGAGSLAGGVLSKKYPSRLPHFFFFFEILIGIFGIASLPLIKMVSYSTVQSSMLKISLATSALLFFPTMLMGATLPVLVAHLHSYYKNVGKTVGKLYFMNTVGSAIACFITADILFVFFGKQATVVVAALCNFLVGLLVYRYTKEKSLKVELKQGNEAAGLLIKGRTEARPSLLRLFVILFLSAATGYISLSQEILWFRAISYTTGGRPDVFAHILGFFLFGIAFGAFVAKKISEKEKDYTLIFIAAMLSLSSVFYYVSLPLAGALLSSSESLGTNSLYLSVAIVSFLAGGIFPAICHFGIKSAAAVGLSLSWIYFANIFGSTAGPLLTGFVLLNSYTLQQNFLYLSLTTLILSGLVWINCPVSSLSRKSLIGGIALAMAGMVSFHSDLYSQILEKLHYKTQYTQKKPYKYVVQNRSGIVAAEAGTPDIVYGGGMYDGRINISPVRNSNLVTRAYLIAAFHPNPEDVLLIGLGSGSWARVIPDYPGVKKLDIVEINPGYIELIKHYPEIATILHDPKITVHIDDGRRWLNRNPDKKFDFIVMNTTFHWRDGVTNLLSEEFLKLCKSHLKKGGMLYYNMTFSEDVPFTASQVFQHIGLYRNLVVAGDSSFAMTSEERRVRLAEFENCGRPIFPDGDAAAQKALEELSKVDIPDRGEILRRSKGLYRITDDNMATEFKRRHKYFDSDLTWMKLLGRFRSPSQSEEGNLLSSGKAR